jgi:hypothetical protein
MTEEEKKKIPEEESKERSGSISRREFAIGSMAAIGALSLAEAKAKAAAISATAPAAEMKLEISSAVKTLMDERHILEADIRHVIENAERQGDKLYQPDTDRFLSKRRSGETYFYVEYSPAEGGFRIHTTYAHRFEIMEN